MLRRLIVMRHAKSSWSSDAQGDHGRPLNKRGRRDAPAVAARLCELNWLPEAALSSDSARTRETLTLMLDQFDPRPQAAYLPSLYQGGIHQLREAVAGLSSDIKTVLVLGHNPGWAVAVTWLTGEPVDMTTGNAALLESSGDTWREALHGEGAWELVEIVRPKELIEEVD
jgi:phosphohistidine phosphatase